MLHNDYAPGHKAVYVNDVLTKKGIPVLPQPQTSPDLNPCDFFLFSKLKFHSKGRDIGTVDNIHKVVTHKLRTFPHRLPTLLPGLGKTTTAVCGFPRELL
jgi:hypothetical protein